MAFGISPLVDFAFKLMLGNPEHSDIMLCRLPLLSDLLNTMWSQLTSMTEHLRRQLNELQVQSAHDALCEWSLFECPQMNFWRDETLSSSSMH